MFQSQKLEVTVGIFVLIALLLLSTFVISVSDLSLFEKGTVIHVKFDFANGLKKSSPVRFAGVDAGSVQEINVVRDPQTNQATVQVSLWLNDHINVPNDSRVMINQLGLLGEKYVEIMPGVSDAMLVDGDAITGDNPVAMEDISKTVHNLASKVEVTLNSINEGILSEDNQQAFSATLAGANDLMAELNQLTAKMNSGEGTIGRLIGNPAIHDNLEEMTADLKANPWKLFYRPRKSKD